MDDSHGWVLRRWGGLFMAVTMGTGAVAALRQPSSVSAGNGAAAAAAPNAPDSPRSSREAGFLAENDAAMRKMMADMEVAPTGDVDRDFVAMMVPHHQGAIDMARAVLRFGRNEQVRRLAQEIIVTQQQEIAAMRLAVGQPPPSTAPVEPSSAAAPATERAAPHDTMHHDGMRPR
jgi:uncharacterized protein (DUF305 family)